MPDSQRRSAIVASQLGHTPPGRVRLCKITLSNIATIGDIKSLPDRPACRLGFAKSLPDQQPAEVNQE